MAELLDAHVRVEHRIRRAFAWPRPSHYLTQVPRRPQHRLSSWAGSQVLAPPFSTQTPDFSIPHTSAPNPEIAAQTDDAQVASPESKESPSRQQRGPERPEPNCKPDLPPGPGPGPAPAPELRASFDRVTCRWSCEVPADRRYVPAAKAGDISSVSTADPFPIVGLGLTLSA